MTDGKKPPHGTPLDRHRHICVLDHCKDEEYQVLRHGLARFSASSVVDVLRSHPVAVIGGIVHENPFFVPPGELLRERQGQLASGPGAIPVA